MTIGANFAKDCADDEKLSDVLAKLDRRSLSRLMRLRRRNAAYQACVSSALLTVKNAIP